MHSNLANKVVTLKVACNSLAAMELCSFYPEYMYSETDYSRFSCFIYMLMYNIGFVYSLNNNDVCEHAVRPF